MTYSLDFRKKVLEIQKRQKLTFQETAARFDIGTTTLVRWHKRLETRQSGVSRPARKKIDDQALLLDVQHYPDAYHYERATRFGVCPKSIWRALKRLGVSYKKNTQPSQGERPRTYTIPRDD
jgi:transposase